MDTRARAGRQAALLLGLGALRALLGAVTAFHDAGALVALALADLALAVVALRVPWQRLPRRASLLVVPPTLGLMAVSEVYGLIPQRAMSVPFMLLFAWVGANHPRWTSLRLVPLAALAYGLPMLSMSPGFDLRAVVLGLCGSVLVAEIIALAVDSAERGHARAERAAKSFGAVARASAHMHDLDPDRVLDAVTDAVIDLGYDGAALALIDTAQEQFRPMRARGISLTDGVTPFRVGEGASGEALRSGQPIVVADYQSSPLSIPPVRAAGVRSAVSVPVFCRGRVVAVLFAASLERRTIPEEQVEAVRVLAATAGAALDNAQRFLAERTSAQRHEVAALTDPLTGLGNRRYAHTLLEGLSPGAAVVLIDLDHFKDVNDNLGHAAGDVVLRSLATHLVESLREHDRVARFGGEEFLVVLPDTEPGRAAQSVERIIETWRAKHPVATFSAGIAHHVAGPAAVTLERADRALYAAKAAGRDTWRTEQELTVELPEPRCEEPPVVRPG